ncbi:hypothetical protein RYO59_000894 [Thermosynechococcaceae cyanobacterium Okahandja]
MTLTYDFTVKRLIHADAGIAEYWLVNLNTKNSTSFETCKMVALPQNKAYYLQQRQSLYQDWQI